MDRESALLYRDHGGDSWIFGGVEHFVQMTRATAIACSVATEAALCGGYGCR